MICLIELSYPPVRQSQIIPKPSAMPMPYFPTPMETTNIAAVRRAMRTMNLRLNEAYRKYACIPSSPPTRPMTESMTDIATPP